jgi:hypothetical protein
MVPRFLKDDEQRKRSLFCWMSIGILLISCLFLLQTIGNGQSKLFSHHSPFGQSLEKSSTNPKTNPTPDGCTGGRRIALHEEPFPLPPTSAYRRSCLHYRTENKTLPTEELPPLRDPDHFVDRLLGTFHNRRVVLLGDSLMRQWFETLSHRLGMEQSWFESSSKPQRLVQAEAFGIQFLAMHKPPEGMNEAEGYSIASTPRKEEVEMGAGLPTRFRSASSRSPCDEENNNEDPILLNTTLEYFHMDVLFLKNQGLSSVPPVALFEFLFKKSDVVVVNVGLHYGKGGDFGFLQDIQIFMHACSQVRDKLNQELFSDSSSKDGGRQTSSTEQKMCVYREVFPQHFIPARNEPTYPAFPDNFEFNISRMSTETCGPFDRNVNPLLFRKSPPLLDEMARSYNIPVVKVQDMLKDAWQWHKGASDCTHFCQDNELWDLIHDELIEHIMRSSITAE